MRGQAARGEAVRAGARAVAIGGRGIERAGERIDVEAAWGVGGTMLR